MSHKKILVVEPYYGGSHQQFIEGLVDNVPAEYTILSLPARKWKMRMQLSAPWFVRKIDEMEISKRFFDAVLFSTFIDVAVFKALIVSVHNWNNSCKYLLYFHENQFSYPGKLPKKSNHQFTAINFTSALIADFVAFNSNFNRINFLAQCRDYTRKAIDMNVEVEVDRIEKKSFTLYPGIDFRELDRLSLLEKNDHIPLIIWNHRWEHDKNPEDFFEVLSRLQEEGINFRLAVLGQRFSRQPVCFDIAKKKFDKNIIHFGYIEDRIEYYKLLVQGNIVVSTALHEFYGIAVLEAVRAGCVPVLPDRLSYQELFDGAYLYEDGMLLEHLKKLLCCKPALSRSTSKSLTERYSWHSLAEQYRCWLGIHQGANTNESFTS